MRKTRTLLAMVGAAAVLVAGTAVGDPAVASNAPIARSAASTAPVPGPMPAWMTYARPTEFTSVVTRDLRVPVRDGSYLSCNLYRPGTPLLAPAPGRFPAVMFQYHGYADNRAGGDSGQMNSLAQRGYVGLQCSTRGTGGTPGKYDLFSAQEAEDGYDAVEWLGTQDFTNGDVAMMGYSYGAVNAYRVAGLRPPHLRTVVSHAAWEDLYTDIAHLGGIRGLDVRVFLFALVQALNAAGTPPDQKVALEQRLIEIDAEWGEHPLDDDFWKKYDIDFEAIRQSGIPILTHGGWYDIFQRGVPRLYQRLQQQSYLVMDNVAHVESREPSFFGKTSGPALAWLDHWLQPERNAPLPSAKVTAYQMPSDSGWTELADWPPPGTGERTLHLDADDALSDQPGAPGSQTYTVDPNDGMPTYWNGPRPDDADMVAWHTARETERTHFTTPALTEDLVLSGSPRAVIDASFTADDGYLVARLSDVAPDGTATQVSAGWLQASLANGSSVSVPVPPGQRARYEVEIWDVNWRFQAGHRLQLSISSGDVPRIHADAPEGEVTVFTGEGGSVLQVPVAGPATPQVRTIDAACPEGEGGVPRDAREDDDGNTHERAIDCIIWWGIARGTTDTKYEPGKPVNREQMASYIAQLIEGSGGELPNDPPDAFADDNGSVHEGNINKLAAAGLIRGRSAGVYAPLETVNRAQMATFLVSSYEHVSVNELDGSHDYFADDGGNVHQENINKAARAGFTAGRGSGYDPAGDVRRDQMASFLARALDLLVDEGTTEPHA